MKIKLSIRLYIFAMLTSCALLIATLFSLHSAEKFLTGFNTAISNLMKEIGRDFDEKKQNDNYLLGYHATSEWQKVPLIIRGEFLLPPKIKDVVHKRFIGWSLIFPPEKSFELMLTTSKKGQLVYISKYREREESFMMASGFNRLIYSPIFEIVIFSVIILLVFMGVLLYVFKQIANPVEELQCWVKSIKMDDLKQPVPNFKFEELQALAQIVHSNVNSMSESVQREETFLSFASHELRTPITILRSNSILLDKISPNPSEQEVIIRNRIQRASITMKNLTETLLWLSRDTIENIKEEELDIKKMLEDTITDCHHLLAGKNITVTLTAEPFVMKLPLAVSKILLANLIENAIQHSQQGQVTILQNKTIIEIFNQDENHQSANPSDDMAGFGLGLKLVQKVTKKFNWYYHSKKLAKGYSVKIDFAKQTSV